MQMTDQRIPQPLMNLPNRSVGEVSRDMPTFPKHVDESLSLNIPRPLRMRSPPASNGRIVVFAMLIPEITRITITRARWCRRLSTVKTSVEAASPLLLALGVTYAADAVLQKLELHRRLMAGATSFWPGNWENRREE